MALVPRLPLATFFDTSGVGIRCGATGLLGWQHLHGVEVVVAADTCDGEDDADGIAEPAVLSD